MSEGTSVGSDDTTERRRTNRPPYTYSEMYTHRTIDHAWALSAHGWIIAPTVAHTPPHREHAGGSLTGGRRGVVLLNCEFTRVAEMQMPVSAGSRTVRPMLALV